MTTVAAAEAPQHEIGDQGVKANALGFASNVVIGVASTPPAYSLARPAADGAGAPKLHAF
jgi:hypothetical protein